MSWLGKTSMGKSSRLLCRHYSENNQHSKGGEQNNHNKNTIALQEVAVLEGWQSGTRLRERRSSGRREHVVDSLDCRLVLLIAVLMVCEKGKRARLDSAAAAAAPGRTGFSERLNLEPSS
jgi:hypothetical protein